MKTLGTYTITHIELNTKEEEIIFDVEVDLFKDHTQRGGCFYDLEIVNVYREGKKLSLKKQQWLETKYGELIEKAQLEYQGTECGYF